jgi:retinol dehydrogenase-12
MASLDLTPASAPVAVLTGGAQGIGRATAPGLLRAGFHLVLLVRSHDRGMATRASLVSELGAPIEARVDWVVADLESGEAIGAATETLCARYPNIHLLVNNAGVVTRRHQLTAEGIERTLAVNHLAYVRVVRGVLPALLASVHQREGAAIQGDVPIGPQADVRIVQVSSDAHAKRLDLTAFSGPRGFSPYGAYAQTKLLNLFHTFDLAEALLPFGITANALHPGLISTGLLDSFFPPGPIGAPFRALARWKGKSVEEGARTPTLVATDPSIRGVTGGYFRRGAQANPAPVALDPVLRNGVRQWTESLVGFDWREGIPSLATELADAQRPPSA